MAHDSSPPWARVAPPQHHAAQVRLPAPSVRPHPRPTAIPTTSSAPVTPMPEFFIGNVPIHPNTAFKIEDDKIADPFHKSSRKTLNFIPPSMQNGEVIVRPSIDIIRAGSQCWNTSAVGYFLGKKPYFHHLNEFVRSIWPAVFEVKATSNGFFFFQFENVAAMEEVIEGEVPIWIKLRHLPVELWTTEGLSTVASGIGRPLYPDAITLACTRLDFARVCVMLNVNSKLPKHVVIMMPNELGGKSACKVHVEYEWIPHKCTGCLSLGHSTKECPISKPTKPAVSIYVREVKATSNGFFFFQFENVAAMEEVIEGGPWLYLGQPIVLQKWEPGMVLRKLKHTEVPIWIKLRHLPVELWTTEGLSTVASGIGRPLYPDAITLACTRLDFARVCVMLNVNSKLPKHVVIMMPNELGGESACKVHVEYEWIPHKCTGCLSLGHSTKECPISKPTKPAVSIYVRKSTPTIPVAPELKLMEKVHAAPVSEEIHHQPEIDRVGAERPEHGRDKGKDIVLFNAFDLLRETDDDADGLSRGPNISNPSDVSPC
ncbi:hypothetical protein Sango_2997400 [Sesamum angolense]|uniref:CCHC-type domain-containing protein n=1 Tax=Sesamum angolense TaxID=2727404 RepID=A0AAE1VXA0_9LAMI|nr:hypothetical protein Sango_2997400 [Sesamum angolense]